MRSTGSLAIISVVLLILAATVLLGLPGVLPTSRLSLPDAMLLAVSAATLTGLTPVAVSALTPFGQAVLLLVFQAAGILLIACSTFLLACPGLQCSKSSHRLGPQRWLAIEELSPVRLFLAIALSTLLIEAAGATALYLCFRAETGVSDPVFAAAFQAASAFCNAGFATLPIPGGPGGIASAVLIALLSLSVLGGLGFVVLRALALWATRRQPTLGFHSRLVLGATLLLLVLGATLYYLFERLPPGAEAGRLGWLEALFQAASVRTAGFELAARQPVTTASRLLSAMLMLIGGAPGSAAGGLKVTTVATVLLVAIRGLAPGNRAINVARQRLSAETQAFAALYLLRALFLLALCALALATTETLFGTQAGVTAGSLVFEAISAFTSAGISAGVTRNLSAPGKAVLALTMLAGRLGLLLLAARMSAPRRARDDRLMLRKAEVLFGG